LCEGVVHILLRLRISNLTWQTSRIVKNNKDNATWVMLQREEPHVRQRGRPAVTSGGLNHDGQSPARKQTSKHLVGYTLYRKLGAQTSRNRKCMWLDLNEESIMWKGIGGK
jgi:hypothetical protein